MKRALELYNNKTYQEDFVHPFAIQTLCDFLVFDTDFKVEGNKKMRHLLLSKYALESSYVLSQVIHNLQKLNDLTDAALNKLTHVKHVHPSAKNIKISSDYTSKSKQYVIYLNDLVRQSDIIDVLQCGLIKIIKRMKMWIARYRNDIFHYEIMSGKPKETIGGSLVDVILLATSLLDMINEIQEIKDKSRKMNEEREWISLRNFLIDNELIMYDKKPYDMNQMELTMTILLLTDKWLHLKLFTEETYNKVTEYIGILEMSVARLVNNAHSINVLNGKYEYQTEMIKVDNGKGVTTKYICSDNYKADIASMFGSFYRSLCLIDHIQNSNRVLPIYKHKKMFGNIIDDQNNSYQKIRSIVSFDVNRGAMINRGNEPMCWFNQSCITLVKSFNKWFLSQLETYKSMSYRAELGSKWIDFFIRYGESDRFERNRTFSSSTFDKTEAISFCRGKNVITYWNDFVNKVDFKKIFTDDNDIYTDIFIMFMVDKFFKGIRFEFEKEVVILEKDFYDKKKDIVHFRNYPFILQIMNQFFVLVKKQAGQTSKDSTWEVYRLVTFKNSFIFWLMLISIQNLNTKKVKVGASEMASLDLQNLLSEILQIKTTDLSSFGNKNNTPMTHANNTIKSDSGVIYL